MSDPRLRLGTHFVLLDPLVDALDSIPIPIHDCPLARPLVSRSAIYKRSTPLLTPPRTAPDAAIIPIALFDDGILDAASGSLVTL